MNFLNEKSILVGNGSHAVSDVAFSIECKLYWLEVVYEYLNTSNKANYDKWMNNRKRCCKQENAMQGVLACTYDLFLIQYTSWLVEQI